MTTSQTPGASEWGLRASGQVSGPAVAEQPGEGWAAGPGVAPPRVIGIDLSLSSTGVADSWRGIRLDAVNTPPAGDDLAARRRRLVTIHRSIWGVISRHSIVPDLVVIEGPSYGSTNGQNWDRAGLWWLVVDHFHQLGPVPIPVAVVPPAVVKKYATGKGTATKADMRMALYQRAGLDERDDNKVDAWWLAAMGLDHLGYPPVKMPAANRDALDRVAWPSQSFVPPSLAGGSGCAVPQGGA
jgi:crossover junction endodeoxyribonuclease RuvC